MKRVLVVFDGEHFSNGAFDFACNLNTKTPILLTSLFLPAVDYSDVLKLYLGGMAGPLDISSLDTDQGMINANVEKFKALCQENKIEYKIHADINIPVNDVVKRETRYADLLVLSSELFYINLGSAAHETYLKEAMHHAECPMIVVPEEYQFPESIILAFDGSKSSVFAIKQFSYLFPELSGLSTLVLYSSEKGDIPDLSYLEEYAGKHFNNITIFKLDADPKKYLNTWISDCGNAFLVTGSYGRSSFSEVFKKNFAEDVIKGHKLPVFIAHM